MLTGTRFCSKVILFLRSCVRRERGIFFGSVALMLSCSYVRREQGSYSVCRLLSSENIVRFSLAFVSVYVTTFVKLFLHRRHAELTSLSSFSLNCSVVF